jgi:hypothetical protein
LQKNGEAIPSFKKNRSGRKMQNIRIAYFKSEAFRVIRNALTVFFIFGAGILYNSSCTRPKGHKNEHTIRPIKVPVKRRKPVTKKGNLPFEIEFCSVPRGQAAIAPGHE